MTLSCAARSLARLLVVLLLAEMSQAAACAGPHAFAARARPVDFVDLKDIPHVHSFTQDVAHAVADARAQPASVYPRVLAVPSSKRLSYTGGQKNFNFLTVGLAQLGSAVSAITPAGEIDRYFPRMGVAQLPVEPLYVARTNVPLLSARLESLSCALEVWRRAPNERAHRNQTLHAFAQAAELLSGREALLGSSPRALTLALDALPANSTLQKALELVVFGTRVRRAVERTAPEVCLVDLTHEALAIVLAGIGERARIVWYVQNVGMDVDNAILANEVNVVGCSASVIEEKFAHIPLAHTPYVVPNGIALYRYDERPGAAAQSTRSLRKELALPPDALVVGQLAALLENKDQLVVVEAMAEVMQKAPHSYLVLIGGLLDEDYVDKVRARAKRLGMAENVVFLGERDDVAELLPQLDVAVSASHNEGYGMATAEAMAAGRPLILSRITPAVALAGDAALYFPVGDAHALAAQILALNDKEARVTRAAASQRRGREILHSQAEMLATFAAALQQIAAQTPKPHL